MLTHDFIFAKPALCSLGDGRIDPIHERLWHDLVARLPQGLEILKQMVDINSFTSNSEGVSRLARYTAAVFQELGFTAEFVPSTNPSWGDHLVLTRRGTSSKSVGLVSHLDTVFPPEEELRNNFHWRIEGDRIYGPGTHDIKGGTMLIWLVLSSFRNLWPDLYNQVTWHLCLNSSEECFSPDFGDVCRRVFKPGTMAALVFEAEGRKEGKPLLVVGRKGRASWRVTARGRGAHAGGHHEAGANAVVQLASTVQRIHALTDYSRSLTVNIGTIHGGTVLNRVPHEAVAEGEFRAFTREAFEQARSALLELGGAGDIASKTGYKCSVQVEILTETRPWPRNQASDALFEIWRTTAESVGMSVGPQERGGLSDGNLLWDAVPTLDGLGPYGENDHCSEHSPDGSKTQEFVSISSIVPKALLNCAALESLIVQGVGLI